MLLSKAPMKAAAFTSVRPAAMEVKTSITSSCVSASAAPTSTKRRRADLRPIAGIDLNVLFREVARPEAGGALAAAIEHNLDGAVRRIEFALELLLGEIGRDAVLADQRVLEENVQFRGVERHSGVARGANDAAPIGVGTGDGGLDQRRIRDGAGDALSRVVAG